MTVAESQQEVRTVFLGGTVGQIVSGSIWMVSAAFGTWGARDQAIIALVA